MWEKIKDAIFGLKDTLGIEIPEIPGLPADLASVGDVAGAATQGLSESAAGVAESLGGAGAAAAGDVAGGVDTLSGVPAAAADAVAPAAADLTETLSGIAPTK